MKHIPIRYIFWIFGVSRILLVSITYIAYILLTAPKYTSTSVDSIALLTSWNHWDAANFVRIAQSGYQPPFDLAFFPLFPLLISIIAYPLGPWSYIVVGMLLSNAALFAAMIIIYQLARDIAGEQIARRTLLYICIFPTTFFFFAAYNESLLLVLAAGSFLALRHQHWWLAGLLGFFAALTRSAGLLLVIPYLIEVWQIRTTIAPKFNKLLLTLLPVALIPCGTLLYCLYCWYVTGDPIAFATVQSHWSRQLSWPWVGIWQAITSLFFPPQQPFGSSNQAHLLLDLTATLGFLFLIILGWKKLPKSYSIWMAFLLAFIILTPALGKPDILLSNQRFVLEMFPAFMTLAILSKDRPRLHQALVLIFPTLLAVLSIAFLMNRWIV